MGFVIRKSRGVRKEARKALPKNLEKLVSTKGKPETLQTLKALKLAPRKW
jgi:hypothetical protein